PALEKFFTLHFDDKVIEANHAENKVGADANQTERRRQPVIAKADKIRQIDIRKSHDLMRIPPLPRPEKVPAGTTEEGSDDNHGDPQNVKTEKERQDLPLSIFEAVITVAARVDVDIRDHHEPDNDETRQDNAGVPRIEINQHLLQAEKIPRRLRRVRRAR